MSLEVLIDLSEILSRQDTECTIDLNQQFWLKLQAGNSTILDCIPFHAQHTRLRHLHTSFCKDAAACTAEFCCSLKRSDVSCSSETLRVAFWSSVLRDCSSPPSSLGTVSALPRAAARLARSISILASSSLLAYIMRHPD